MNPDILDKILRVIIVFLQVEKLGRIPLGNVSVRGRNLGEVPNISGGP
jgi:hypothetical protein